MKKILIPIILAALVTLSGCAGTVSKPSVEPQKQSIAERTKNTKAAMHSYGLTETIADGDKILLSKATTNTTKNALASTIKSYVLEGMVNMSVTPPIAYTDGNFSMVANAYQAYDANMILWPSGVTATEIGYVDFTSSGQTQLNAKQSIVGATYPVGGSATTPTGNVEIDGLTADHYYYSNGASAATYTPVITSPPASGERGIILTVGGGAGVITMTWANVSWIGTAGAATTTANKFSHYACFILSSGNAKCKIIEEASDN